LDLPTVLTPPAAAVAVWVAAASGGRVLTGIFPGAIAAAVVVGAHVLWRRRGKLWHDGLVIVALLPALACGLWIGVGGIVLDVPRSDAGRLLVEVGPGLALTGLVTTIISYHGRHDPRLTSATRSR
jgi:hypothetical protein